MAERAREEVGGVTPPGRVFVLDGRPEVSLCVRRTLGTTAVLGTLNVGGSVLGSLKVRARDFKRGLWRPAEHDERPGCTQEG